MAKKAPNIYVYFKIYVQQMANKADSCIYSYFIFSLTTVFNVSYSVRTMTIVFKHVWYCGIMYSSAPK